MLQSNINKIKFSKMVASGNDFVVIENSYRLQATGYRLLAKNICNRKYGVGADGLLVLEKSKVADIRMRIFNPDGTEAEMCGNGARCIALYMGRVESKIETKAGIISSKVNGERERIKLTDPKNLSLDTPLKINNRVLHVNFIDTGVPHVGVFVQGLEAIEVVSLGRKLRYHQRFAPKGTNANFIEVLDNHSIKIRTYERGVEDETLACGTGTVASALLFALKNNARDKINVYTRSKEVLRVYFKKQGSKFSDVWLEGKARLVFKGEAKL